MYHPEGRLRFALPVMACFILIGCQSMPGREAEETPPAVEETDAAKDQASDVTLEAAMDLLQDGEEDRAEGMLEAIIEERPDAVTARLLLSQIRREPEELLGTQFEEVEVRAGESLSEIAERTIGNGLLFYSLAKLNRIEVPRLLRSGQQIRVPVDTSGGGASQAATGQDGEASTADAGALNDSGGAKELLERQRFSSAFSLLLDTARAGDLDASGREMLAQSAVQLARVACREDDVDRAGRYLEQATPWIGALSEKGDFLRQRHHVEARLGLGEAEGFLASGDEVAAFSALIAAREKSPELADAHRSRLTRLETALAEHFHGEAITAWRDQQVDRSVELWDRVVRIDPDFEPAIRYLERARRAQRELKALENG